MDSRSVVVEGRADAAQSHSRARSRSPAMLASTSLLLLLVAVSQQVTITKFEVPNSVKQGDDAVLRCEYKLAAGESEEGLIVKWWRTPLDPDDDEGVRKQIYQRISDSKPAILQHNIELKDSDTIVLLNVTISDSAIYECEVDTVDESRIHQELIVYTEGTGPQLNVSEIEDGPDEDDEEDVLIECQAYDVAPIPDFILTVNGEETSMNVLVVGPDAEGLYELSGNYTASKETLTDADIRCELVYMNTDVTHPPYIDVAHYQATGALTTTEVPEDTTQLDATPHSLQNPSDHGTTIQISWTLLLTVGILTSLCI